MQRSVETTRAVTAFVFDERESEQVEDWQAALEGSPTTSWSGWPCET